MDGLISDEFFTIPVVLENQNVGQAVNTMGYKGLQVVMAKDQPLLILDAGNLNFQNVPDPLMLSNTNNSFINTIDLPISREDIEHTLDDTEIEQVATRDKVNDDELNLDITPNEDLMDELIETLVIYKCKLCPFKTSEKNCLSKHLVSEHGANLKNDLNQDTLLKTVTGKDTEAGCSAREEQMVYMCANCTEAFVTYADCRIHMALVHKIMIGNVKSEDVKAELFNTNLI
ncbi:hypothetical protein O3M35_011191 [Rhynocoris fuscipes]|uniref:C2H2-type domain-containing protein n=1 Tax=Rhynocoris fuscipes TaxID=488301 RepID=A0AAW1CXK4_9HEMI